jgi:hypothetical protein
MTGQGRAPVDVSRSVEPTPGTGVALSDGFVRSARNDVNGATERERAHEEARAGRPRDRAAALLPPCFFAASAPFYSALPLRFGVGAHELFAGAARVIAARSRFTRTAMQGGSRYVPKLNRP